MGDIAKVATFGIAGDAIKDLLTPKVPDIPAPPPPAPMVDEEAVRQARRKALASKKRDGYESTLLSEAGKE